jgi:hypothetical protein
LREAASGAALAAVAPDLNTRDQDLEPAEFPDLALQLFEQDAFKLRYLAAAQARHMKMVATRAPFVEVAFAFDMHKVEFIDQTLPFQKGKCPIHGYTIDARINLLCFSQDLGSVEVAVGCLDDPHNDSPLSRHADTARCKIGE